MTPAIPDHAHDGYHNHPVTDFRSRRQPFHINNKPTLCHRGNMFPSLFTHEFEYNASLWSEIGRPILRDWEPDRKHVIYLRQVSQPPKGSHGLRLFYISTNRKVVKLQ